MVPGRPPSPSHVQHRDPFTLNDFHRDPVAPGSPSAAAILSPPSAPPPPLSPPFLDLDTVARGHRSSGRKSGIRVIVNRPSTSSMPGAGPSFRPETSRPRPSLFLASPRTLPPQQPSVESPVVNDFDRWTRTSPGLAPSPPGPSALDKGKGRALVLNSDDEAEPAVAQSKFRSVKNIRDARRRSAFDNGSQSSSDESPGQEELRAACRARVAERKADDLATRLLSVHRLSAHHSAPAPAANPSERLPDGRRRYNGHFLPLADAELDVDAEPVEHLLRPPPRKRRRGLEETAGIKRWTDAEFDKFIRFAQRVSIYDAKPWATLAGCISNDPFA